MEITFRKVEINDNLDPYRLTNIPSIFGIDDKIAVSVTTKYDEVSLIRSLSQYGVSPQIRWSKDIDNIFLDAFFHKHVKHIFIHKKPLFVLVPPTYGVYKKNKIQKYLNDIIGLLKSYGITKLHFTHYANSQGDLNSDEIRAILNEFLSPHNKNFECEICWDIQEKNSRQIRNIYKEISALQGLNHDIRIMHHSRFSWRNYIGKIYKNQININSGGLYAVYYTGNEVRRSTGNDQKRSKGGIEISKDFVKIGKSEKPLKYRYKNYENDFGVENIRFFPLMNSNKSREDERKILDFFKDSCVKRDRITYEWMKFYDENTFMRKINEFFNA